MITAILFLLKAWAISFLLTVIYACLRLWIVSRAERKDRDHRSREWLKKAFKR